MFTRRAHAAAVAGRGQALGAFKGNPYLFLGRRPSREERLRSYIVREHRAGRAVSEILRDPYVRRCGSESFCWKVLEDPRTLEAIVRTVHEAGPAAHPDRRKR